MMMKTHLAIAMAFILYLILSVKNQFLFFTVTLIATLLPDIDISNSYMGKKWYFAPVRWFVGHRGIVHSLTLCVIISAVLAYFIPIIAFPFFLGYSVHLLADSFTIDGIKPFWPLNSVVSGNISTGGKLEEITFSIFCILDVMLLIRVFL